MAMQMANSSSIGPVVYPESDGQPMGATWLHVELMFMLKHGFDRLFADRPDAIVGSDNFWYPVEGDATICVIPDVMVIVDMPRRPTLDEIGCYRQWEHGGRVLLTVEVTSPSNSWAEMFRKLRFYEQYGVEEYWVFDPVEVALQLYVRRDGRLVETEVPDHGFVSPATGVTERLLGRELAVFEADGRRWLYTADEARRLNEMAARAEELATLAEREAARAEQEAARAAAAERRIAELEAQLRQRRG